MNILCSGLSLSTVLILFIVLFSYVNSSLLWSGADKQPGGFFFVLFLWFFRREEKRFFFFH